MRYIYRAGTNIDRARTNKQLSTGSCCWISGDPETVQRSKEGRAERANNRHHDSNGNVVHEATRYPVLELNPTEPNNNKQRTNRTKTMLDANNVRGCTHMPSAEPPVRAPARP
jgi:hypothetical protein